ncbi:MAG: hypothetical protein MUE38_09425 [Flavihumibacter sp.]|jgi:hypothetical protein|nr:hypothetical protein [Flavihumibacter sp.]
MKKVLTILLGLLFLVASLPGVALQQLVDPASLTELTNSGDQRSATEEKQEEHFIHYRTRVQAAQLPVSTPIRVQAVGSTNPEKQEQLNTRVYYTPGAPLYLQHRSFLI